MSESDRAYTLGYDRGYSVGYCEGIRVMLQDALDAYYDCESEKDPDVVMREKAQERLKERKE